MASLTCDGIYNDVMADGALKWTHQKKLHILKLNEDEVEAQLKFYERSKK